MKGVLLFRFGIGLLAFMAVLGALLEIAREDVIDVRPLLNITDSSDPLAAELRRCQSLGDAALDDQACASAWAETRRRFLPPALQSEPRE